MTKINWPHGPETLAEHLERFSDYLYKKRSHNIGNLTVAVYGLYLHYNTEYGYQSEMYEDLNRPLKNKVFTTVGLDGVYRYGETLIQKIKTELTV